MDDYSHLDIEFERYLQILKHHLGNLVDKEIKSICNAWIDKLECSDKEKILRNKYIFSLCYQIAKGTLDNPFLEYPSEGNLSPLNEDVASDTSSTEVECYVVNPEDPNTEVLFGKENCNLIGNAHEDDNECDSIKSSLNSKRSSKQTITCYAFPNIYNGIASCNTTEIYELRANNLIKKLRDIKVQNMTLHNELIALKEESIISHNNSFVEDVSTKVDRATSTHLQSSESSSTLKSLKNQLQEAHDSRNTLIERIKSLQDELDNINELKTYEVGNVEAKYKLEIINIKSSIREEVKNTYVKKLEDMKAEYELNLNTLQNKSCAEVENISTAKDDLIQEKDKIIIKRDKEIFELKNEVEDLKNRLRVIMEKLIEKPIWSYNEENSWKMKCEELEKRLYRVEKSKMKCTRLYEANISQLQREKHMAECALQLQMVRQRAQIVNVVTDENQTELATALGKLETKYKEIVANVQATAIQTRIQDQMALESILQAACGIPNENNHSHAQGNKDQFPKAMRNQNPSSDRVNSVLCHEHKVGNCVGNKSLGEHNSTGYCLNEERMGELFERVYIPQRDNHNSIK